MIVERHPILRNAALIGSALLAASTVVLSALISSHTIPWLLGFYLTTTSLFVSLRRRSRTPLSRAYALYLSQLTLYLFCVWFLHVCVPGSNPAKTKSFLSPILLPLMPAVILLAIAHLRFARVLSGSTNRLIWLFEMAGWAGSLFFIIQNFLGTFILDFVWARYTWVPKFDGGYKPFFYFTTFFLILGVCVPFVALLRERNQKNRLQLIFYLIGAVPLWISCWINFLISMGVNLYPIGGFAFFFHAAVMTYAITFEQLFDLRLTLRRGLAYALVSVALGAMYGLLLWSVPLLGLVDNSHSILTGTLLAVFAGFFFAPALNYLQEILDRAFFRNEADQQVQLENFARQSSATIDAAVIARLLCETLTRLVSPRRIEVYLQSGDAPFRLFATHAGSLQLSEWPLSAPLAPDIDAALRDKKSTIHVGLSADAPKPAGIHLSLSTDGLAVPLRHNDRTLGCVLLYPRLADEPYSESGVRMIETLAAYTATAFENSRTTGQLDFLRGLTRQTFDHLAAGILIVTQSGQILQHNPAARSLLQPGTAPLPATLDVLSPLHPELIAALKAALANPAPLKNVELQIDGTPRRTVLFSSEALGQQDGQTLFLLVLNEISAYKELENANRRKEALARVGGMIASINHEIKNILQPTRYQIEKLRTVRVEDPLFDNAMRVIHDRMAALDRLLLNLKDLSRPIELRRRALASHQLLQSAWEDVKTIPAAERVQCTMEIQPGAESIQGDGQWLRNVFVNLMKNAVEAMDGQPGPRLSITAAPAGDDVCIRVQDNGAGITPDTLAKLFEPFHSTKAEAGTGLGLSISRRIIELHGGRVDVESEPGKSTTFTVHLPRTKPNTNAEAA